MDISQLTSQISDFRRIVERDAITPESLGALLQNIANVLAKAAEKPSDMLDLPELSAQLTSLSRQVSTMQSSVNANTTNVANVKKGIRDIGHFNSLNDACAYAARSEISGNRDIYLIKFTYNGAAGKVGSCILQAVKGDHIAMQYLFDKCTVMRRNVTGATGVQGANVNAFAWSEALPHSLAYNSSSRSLSFMSYENAAISSVTLPQASTSTPGLMSTADKSALANKVNKDGNKVLSDVNFSSECSRRLQHFMQYGALHFFDGFDDNNIVFPTAGSAAENRQVVFSTKLKQFCIRVPKTAGGYDYYNSWLMTDIDALIPRVGHIYVCESDMYTWNGSDLIKLSDDARITDIEAAINKTISIDDYNVANGVPKLDGNAKISVNQLPDEALVTLPFDGVVETLPTFSKSLQFAANDDQKVFYCTESKTFFAQRTDSSGNRVYTYIMKGGNLYGQLDTNGYTPKKGRLYVNSETSEVFFWNGADLGSLATMFNFDILTKLYNQLNTRLSDLESKLNNN